MDDEDTTPIFLRTFESEETVSGDSLRSAASTTLGEAGASSSYPNSPEFSPSSPTYLLGKDTQ